MALINLQDKLKDRVEDALSRRAAEVDQVEWNLALAPQVEVEAEDPDADVSTRLGMMVSLWIRLRFEVDDDEESQVTAHAVSSLSNYESDEDLYHWVNEIWDSLTFHKIAYGSKMDLPDDV